MGRRAIPRSMLLRVCVYQPADELGIFIAHCLELDLMGQGTCVESALDELLEVIDSQIETCKKTGANFWFYAPARVWQIYAQAKKANRKIASELVERVVERANRRRGHPAPDLENIAASKDVPKKYLAPI